MPNTSKESKGLKIGDLVRELQKEFPKIRESKVRYFEEQGLINPERDQSGYRRYSRKDKDLLRQILSAQRDEYLPLDVISKRLKTGSMKPRARNRKALFLDMPKGEAKEEGRLTESDLTKFSDLTPKQLTGLKEYGILGKGPVYSRDDLEVALATKSLLADGVDPRHLKMFKRSVEQESDLTIRIIAPLLKKIEKNEAYLKLDKLINASKELRLALLKREIRQGINSTG